MFDSKVQPRDGEIWLHLTGNPHPLPRKKSSTYFLLLSSLGYSSQQNLHTTKSELSSFVTAFSVLRFSRSFFSMNESQAAAEGQSTKQKEQATTAVHDEDDSGQNTSPTMLSILSALQASVTPSIKVTVLTFLVKDLLGYAL